MPCEWRDLHITKQNLFWLTKKPEILARVLSGAACITTDIDDLLYLIEASRSDILLRKKKVRVLR